MRRLGLLVELDHLVLQRGAQHRGVDGLRPRDRRRDRHRDRRRRRPPLHPPRVHGRSTAVLRQRGGEDGGLRDRLGSSLGQALLPLRLRPDGGAPVHLAVGLAIRPEARAVDVRPAGLWYA